MEVYIKNIFPIFNNIKFHLDIFESNIINIIILIPLIFIGAKSYVISGTDNIREELSKAYEKTKEKIPKVELCIKDIKSEYQQNGPTYIKLSIRKTIEEIESVVKSKNSKTFDEIERNKLAANFIFDYKLNRANITLKTLVVTSSFEEVNKFFIKLIESQEFHENYTNFSILLLQNTIGEKNYE
uniref:ATP synthase CF0 B subunit n=1 Tax=Haramonas pauciplastida TaxID=478668 RepID=UPI0021145947|nr:ATP synthase CF0 B subunit [Haramonas pauciplastida]UTE94998.1 ATP synthase CF0 B subunit [Haramonas pauciplastida]